MTEMEKKIDAINSKLDTLLEWRAGLNEKCIMHLERTEEHRTALFSPEFGLVGRVGRLENCKKSMSDSKKFWTDVARTVISAAIIGLLGWGFFIYGEHYGKKNMEAQNGNSIDVGTNTKSTVDGQSR